MHFFRAGAGALPATVAMPVMHCRLAMCCCCYSGCCTIQNEIAPNQLPPNCSSAQAVVVGRHLKPSNNRPLNITCPLLTVCGSQRCMYVYWCWWHAYMFARCLFAGAFAYVACTAFLMQQPIVASRKRNEMQLSGALRFSRFNFFYHIHLCKRVRALFNGLFSFNWLLLDWPGMLVTAASKFETSWHQHLTRLFICTRMYA